jgi:16S rRNA (guanine527-N7)-methyltransferase
MGAIEADRARALGLINVSRETLERLDGFLALLLKWQATTNLVGKSTLETLWTRHIADSLQLIDLAPQARTWVDLGSGAGFPGIPIACALTDVRGVAVHLVESNAKKAAFLREAARITGAPVTVHAVRIDKFVDGFEVAADAVTARAVASLKDLLDECFILLHHRAVGLFPKGQDVAVELTEASKYWNMAYDLVPSRTDPEARIVVVRSLARRKLAHHAQA